MAKTKNKALLYIKIQPLCYNLARNTNHYIVYVAPGVYQQKIYIYV